MRACEPVHTTSGENMLGDLLGDFAMISHGFESDLSSEDGEASREA